MEVVVAGFKPYDGTYPWIAFNRYEMGQIRRLSGFMPAQYEEAFNGGDSEFEACIAVLAMKRGGRIEAEEVADVFRRLLDTDDAEIRVRSDDKEAAEEPDPPQHEPSSSESSGSSGPGGNESSETSPTTLKAVGMRDSDISGSVQTRSAL